MIDDDGPGAVALGAEDRARAVAAVKAVLRLSSGEEDALVAGLAESALGLAEQVIGQVLIARTLRETLAPRAGWQRLGAAPVRAITAVTTPGGVALAPTVFALDIDAAGDGWVRVAPPQPVCALFDAGVAEGWDGLPAPVRQGVVLLAAYLFDARDAGGAPPAAVTALWRPFCRVSLGGAGRC